MPIFREVSFIMGKGLSICPWGGAKFLGYSKGGPIFFGWQRGVGGFLGVQRGGTRFFVVYKGGRPEKLSSHSETI